MPIFSHSFVDISIEPDVCSFLRGSTAWKLVEFVPSFPYHILLTGEEWDVLGQLDGIRSEADGKR